MAIKTVTFQTREFTHNTPCSVVTLCLDSSWESKTVSGLARFNATLQNTTRLLAGYRMFKWFSPRQQAEIQYTLTYDDAQFNVDGGTGQPYVVTCNDIKGFIGC
jgi:hypothetical protein